MAENTACTVLMQRDRWEWLQRPNGSKGAYHQCRQLEQFYEGKVWHYVGYFGDANLTETASHPIDPAWRCGGCNKMAPRSIVTLATKEK